jgi:hypothetical protein
MVEETYMSILGVRNIHCGGHVLNVIMQKGFEGLPTLFALSKSFATWIKSSSVNWATLKKHQAEENFALQLDQVIYTIIQEVGTRWNSFYLLLDRILLLKDPITKTLTEINPKEGKLSAEHFSAFQELVFLMAPFEKATRLLSTDKESTIQFVIPTMINLKKDTMTLAITNKEVEDCRNLLLVELDVELQCYLGSNALLIATVCDPRLKSAPFLDETTRNRAYQLIRDTITRMDPPKQSPVKDVSVSHPVSRNYVSNLFTFNVENSNPPIDELTHYLNSSTSSLDFSSDPSEYWVKRTLEYPNLSQIALTHLAIPSSSTASERNNSQMGRTVTKLRNRLDPIKVSQLNVMKGNLDLW